MLSEILFWLGIIIVSVVSLLAAVRSMILWIRSGFRAPGYVHAFAFFALALGAFIAYGEHQDERRIWLEAVLILIMPALVYWAYVAGGGPAEYLDSRALDCYPNGVRAGARLRLKNDLPIYDHEGRPSGVVHRAGEIWVALPGRSTSPDVVRLEKPDGSPHTWDGCDLLQWFEQLSDPRAA